MSTITHRTEGAPARSQPIGGLRVELAATPGLNAAAAAAAAEALYQAAFSVLAKTAAPAPNTPVPQEQRLTAEPQFDHLFVTFIGVEKPSGPIAKDFSRAPSNEPVTLAEAIEIVDQLLQETPKELRISSAKVKDGFVTVLEKQVGLAADPTRLSETPAGQWLCGPKREVLERVAAQLAPGLRQATAKGAKDAYVVDAAGEKSLHELASALPSGILSTDADIESCIQILFMQIGKDAELDLREQLQSLQKRLDQKKAMRDYVAAIRDVQAESKKQLQAEYQALSQSRVIECTFEQFAAMRPISVTQPTLGQDEKTGQWVVTRGKTELTGSWVADPNAVPIALRPQADATSVEALALNYGLSEDAIKALKAVWEASGGMSMSFDAYLANVVKLSKAKTPAEAEANKQQALKVLNAGVPGQQSSSGGTFKGKSSVTYKEVAGKGLYTQAMTAANSSPTGPKSATGNRLTTSTAAVTKTTATVQALIAENKPVPGGTNSGATPEQARAAAIAAVTASTPPKGFGQTPPPLPVDASGMRFEAFDRAIEKAKGDLDTVGDQTAMEQTQMQRYLERRAKAFETLSNVMKKISETVRQIIENTK